MKEYYFDYAATAPVKMEVIKYILNSYPRDFLFGNPSSNYQNGIKAKELLEEARDLIARSLDCKNSNICFTSGGSESDNMALKGIMLQYKPEDAELITSQIEHPAILNTCKELEQMGYTVHYVEPDSYGYIDPRKVENEICTKTKLISIMSVNNEIGTIEPINDIADIAHKHNILFHSDMVQGVGLRNIDLTNIDLASFSGHKFGAIKGTGFLYKKDDVQLRPLINGGGQEKGLRAGTENVFGALDVALSLQNTIKEWENINTKKMQEYLTEFSDDLYETFGDNVIRISLDDDKCVSNCLSLAFRNIDSRTLQLLLAQEGFYISVGSACSSYNLGEVSHVITAIKVPKDYEKGTIRITVPPKMYLSDLVAFLKVLKAKVKYLYESEV